MSRDGKVVAVSARNGHVLWSHNLNTTGYTTPAVAYGRVYVGGFDGYIRAYNAARAAGLVATYVGGRILGPPVVIGNLVFASNLEKRTYAVRASDGKREWSIGMGKYSPLIATDDHYYMTLNGMLIAFRGQHSPPEQKLHKAKARAKSAAGGAAARVATAAAHRRSHAKQK